MAIKVSKNRQNTYAAYKASMKWKTNREAKLRKLIKQNPNNMELVAALKNVSYRRKTPKASFWSHSMKRTAEVLKQFCGRCPHAVFSSNKVVASDTLRNLSKDITRQAANTNYRSNIMSEAFIKAGWRVA